MRVLRDLDALAGWCAQASAEGACVGFVPTMGFLHAGHSSLMDIARVRCDRLIVSVFVNPLQFGPTEDLDKYPRDIDSDAAMCVAHGVDALFLPEESSFYPAGFATQVAVSGLTQRLCGASRPGHFAGVTTVVARLLGLIRPDVAVFGSKDFQQLQVIRRMVQDLALGVEIVAGPIVRDTDGLALSSRNRYLSEANRRRALTLSMALRAMAADDERDVSTLLSRAHAMLDVDRVDYVAIVDTQSLQPIETIEGCAQALLACFVGNTRLIDNIVLNRSEI
jgi:pantoate--beta-alanine ligase